MSKEKVSKHGIKDLRKEVAHQLEISLGKLKEQLGEKKFNSRLKKAVKVFTEDIDTPKKEKPKQGKSILKVSSDVLTAKVPKKSVKVAPADTPPKAARKVKPENKLKK